MSTEHDFLGGSPQLKWLEEDLKSVDRDYTPWVVFSGHRPMYVDSTFSGDQFVGGYLREFVEPLLVKYGVDLALWGHHHSYQRTCPSLVNGTCTCGGGATGKDARRGPMHMVIGMAGYEMSTNIFPRMPSVFDVVDIKSYGFVKLDFRNATAMRTLFVANNDGDVADEYWLYKDGSGAHGQGHGCAKPTQPHA